MQDLEGKPQFSPGRSLFLGGIVTTAVLVLAEIVTRLVGVEPPVRPAIVARSVDVDVDFPFMRADPELFWALVPGFRGSFLGRPVTINRLGMRGPELAVPKPPGRRRVAAFGDSITFGYGVGDEEAYPFLLNRLLSGSGVEVVNAGVTGYTTHQVLRLLRRLEGPLDLDVATFCIGWNDASRRPVDDRTYARRMRAASALDGLARHVYLYRAMKSLYLRALMKGVAHEWDSPPEGQRVPVAQYRENLRALVEECRARAIRPVFIQLPHRRRVGEVAPDSPHAGALSEMAHELRVPLIGLGELGLDATAPSNEGDFIDALHLSPEGNRRFAEQVARELVALGVL